MLVFIFIVLSKMCFLFFCIREKRTVPLWFWESIFRLILFFSPTFTWIMWHVTRVHGLIYLYLKLAFFIYHDLSCVYFFFYRSKSRSVDHGLAAPFANLDSLRSTVEGRFDSVERLSKGLYIPRIYVFGFTDTHFALHITSLSPFIHENVSIDSMENCTHTTRT